MAEEFHLVTKCAGCSTQLQRSCTVCSRCRSRYCGPTCAKRHYENGHSLVCKKIAQRGGAERCNADRKYSEAAKAAVAACGYDVATLNERIAVAARAADVAALNDCPDARSLANYTACYICGGDFSGDLVRGCECRADGSFVHLSCLVHRAKVAIDDITGLGSSFGYLGTTTEGAAFVVNAIRRHWTVCEYCDTCINRGDGLDRKYSTGVAMGWACFKSYVSGPGILKLGAMWALAESLLVNQQHEEAIHVYRQSLKSLPRNTVFQAYYCNQLAKRLLNVQLDKSARHPHDDVETILSAERRIVAQFKEWYGPQFSGKMEGMIQETDAFYNAINTHDLKALTVRVLASGYWPTVWPTVASIEQSSYLPEELATCKNNFEKYYVDKHPNRRLSWMWSLGDATVRAFFGDVSYDLQLTTLQTVVLLLFNPVNGKPRSLGYKAIRMRVNIPEETLKRVLRSLACGRYRILAKTPYGLTIHQADKFAVNTKFSCRYDFIIRMPVASFDDSFPKRVEYDSSWTDPWYRIDAAIVRIMKRHEVMSHRRLMAKVEYQLASVDPDPKLISDIKRRIEALVDRDYLARDLSDTGFDVYRYLP